MCIANPVIIVSSRVESFEWLHCATAQPPSLRPILHPLSALQALSCAPCAIQQMSAEGTEQPLVGMMTDSGEVSDSMCSRLAAALCGSQAHMLEVWILSCGASLTLRCLLLAIQQMCDAKTEVLSSGNLTESGKVGDSYMHGLASLTPRMQCMCTQCALDLA